MRFLATFTVLVLLGWVVCRRPEPAGAAAPALFSANASGRGPAAALVVRATASGSVTTEVLTEPIDLDSETDQVILVLFGSGIRGRPSLAGVRAEIGGTAVPAAYAGKQPDFAGLEQVNAGPLGRARST